MPPGLFPERNNWGPYRRTRGGDNYRSLAWQRPLAVGHEARSWKPRWLLGGRRLWHTLGSMFQRFLGAGQDGDHGSRAQDDGNYSKGEQDELRFAKADGFQRNSQRLFDQHLHPNEG